MCQAHTRGSFHLASVAFLLDSELPLKTNHEKESGSRDGHSLRQLSHGPQNTMNDNNIRNNKATNNSDKNSIYSMPVNYMLDTVLSVFYGLSYFIFTRTLWVRI